MSFAHGTDAFDYIFICSKSKMTGAASIHHFLYCNSSHLTAEQQLAPLDWWRDLGMVAVVAQGAAPLSRWLCNNQSRVKLTAVMASNFFNDSK